MRHCESYHHDAILRDLQEKSPHWLRQQLTNPDPVYLHDWNKTAEQFQVTVNEALKLQEFDQ